MNPEIRTLPKFYVVGATVYGDPHSGVFAKAWEVFHKQMKNVELKGKCYGIEIYTEKYFEGVKWFYMACGEVANLSSIPITLVGKTIPEHKYAVFSCKGGVKEIAKTFHFAYDEWIPKSNYDVADCFDLELYDERFKGIDNPETVIDIYIPIKEKD